MRGKFILSLLIAVCGCSMWPTAPEQQRNKTLRLIAKVPNREYSLLSPKPAEKEEVIYCLKSTYLYPYGMVGDVVKVGAYSGTISCVVEGDFISYDLYENEKIAICSFDSCLLLYNINTEVLDTLLSDRTFNDVKFLDSTTLILLDASKLYKLVMGDTVIESLFEVDEAYYFDISPSARFLVTSTGLVYDFNGVVEWVSPEGIGFAFSPKNDSLLVFASAKYEGYLGIANWRLNKIEYQDSKVAGGSRTRDPVFHIDGNKIFFAATNPEVAGLILYPYQYSLWEYCGVK